MFFDTYYSKHYRKSSAHLLNKDEVVVKRHLFLQHRLSLLRYLLAIMKQYGTNFMVYSIKRGMQSDKKNSDAPNKGHFDLTEAASRRPGGEEATAAARQAESDDINEETGLGKVDSPDGWVENKVAVSDDD